MANPYRDRPAHCFRQSGVAGRAAEGFDPVVALPFTLSRSDAVGTAGRCFARHMAQNLVARGFRFLVTESFQGRKGTADENNGIFPARSGNVHTARQLLQSFDRALGVKGSIVFKRDGAPDMLGGRGVLMTLREFVEGSYARYAGHPREVFDLPDVARTRAVIAPLVGLGAAA